MRLKETAIIIFLVFLSYTVAQSQMTAAERVQEIEKIVIPHLKTLLADNYDSKAGIYENVFKIPVLFNGQAEDSVNDEIITQFDTTGGWENFGKDSFIYNNQMSVRYWIISNWVDSDWENFVRFAYSYNPAGDITQIVLTIWAGLYILI